MLFGATAIWIPTTAEFLTVEEFEHADRRLAEQIPEDPRSIFSIDPRFFEHALGWSSMLLETRPVGSRCVLKLVEVFQQPEKQEDIVMRSVHRSVRRDWESRMGF